MKTTLKRGASNDRIRKILNKLSKEIRSKGVDTINYCGVLKLKEDALLIQKKLRDEWE